jgi:hypothetical protein
MCRVSARKGHVQASDSPSRRMKTRKTPKREISQLLLERKKAMKK